MKKKSNSVLSLEKSFQVLIANYLSDSIKYAKENINVIEIDIDSSYSRAIVYYVTHLENKIKDVHLLEKKVRKLISTHFKDEMRRIPEIIFKYDHTFAKARRISKIIEKLENDEKEE